MFAGTVVGVMDGEVHSVHDEQEQVVRVRAVAFLSRLVRRWDGNRFLDWP